MWQGYHDKSCLLISDSDIFQILNTTLSELHPFQFLWSNKLLNMITN